MKKYFRKFKGILCLLMCLCMALATFQVSVFAEGENASNGEKVEITDPHLTTDNENSWTTAEVFGKGILTGTADNGTKDMDQLCWNREDGTNKGYDDSNANDIIRSFDTITYTISTGFNNLNKETHKLGYQIDIDNDDKVEVLADGFTLEKTEVTTEGKKRYTFTKSFNEKHEEAGVVEAPFTIKVKNKHQGDEITPIINVFVDNEDNKKEVTNVKTVYVTSAPMYNIVLKKPKSFDTSKIEYDFSDRNYGENGTNCASAYDESRVIGFRQVYGVALEVRKPGNGIKGVELPDPSKPFTFEIDKRL